jgi:hypothetical protein
MVVEEIPRCASKKPYSRARLQRDELQAEAACPFVERGEVTVMMLLVVIRGAASWQTRPVWMER